MFNYETLLDGAIQLFATKSLFTGLPFVWLLISMAFLALELSVPGLFFFLPFAAGPAFAAVLCWLGFSFKVQAICSMTVSFAAVFFTQKQLSKHKLSSVEHSSHQSNIDALVGELAIVTKHISEGSRGEVKVGQETWPAISTTEITIEKGKTVRILKIEGNKLIVSQN